MENLLIVFKICLFWLSFLGLSFYIAKKFKIETAFSYIITISLIVLILLFAGFLNILVFASYSLYFYGLFVVIYAVFKKDTTFTIHLFSTSTIWLTFMVLFILFYTRGKIFTHYDNFSHWALAPKVMLIHNRLPNFQDSVFGFKSYPLGASLFVYFFSFLVSSRESIMMTGQAIILLSAITSYFGIKKNNKWYEISIITIITFISITFISGIENLLVDTMLPVVAIAGIIIIDKYKRNYKLTLLSIALLGTFLMQIKNSGVFFFLILVFYFAMVKPNTFSIRNKTFLKYLACLTIPLVISILWSKHVEYSFVSGLTAKHSMSLSNFSNVFAKKSVSDIVSITKNYIYTTLSASHNIRIAFGFILLSVMGYIKNKKFPMSLKSVLFILITFFLYNVGNLAMYIFSMPLFEAERLAGFSRYLATINLFIYLFLFIAILNLTDDSDKTSFNSYILNSSLMIFILIFSALNFPNYKSLFSFGPNYIGSSRNIFKLLTNKEFTNSNSNYLGYLTTRDDAGYMSYVFRYEYLTSNFRLLKVPNDDLVIGNEVTHILVINAGEAEKDYLESQGYKIPDTDSFMITVQSKEE